MARVVKAVAPCCFAEDVQGIGWQDFVVYDRKAGTCVSSLQDVL